MIVVRIELWPYGDSTKTQTLYELVIANTGGTEEIGKYRYELTSVEEGMVVAEGCIPRFFRRKRALHLVARVFRRIIGRQMAQ